MVPVAVVVGSNVASKVLAVIRDVPKMLSSEEGLTRFSGIEVTVDFLLPSSKE